MNSTGEIFEKVYGVLTTSLDEMRDLMKEKNVQEVGMESTSVYWIPVWRTLEHHFKQKNLQTIPGVKLRAATSLIAEIGIDMRNFDYFMGRIEAQK